MPEEPIDLGDDFGEQEVYLIESRSIGGLSGSPVFLNTPPFRFDDKHNVVQLHGHQREYLIGVNIGLFTTKASSDTLPRTNMLDSMSAGIAIVVPIQRAIEIICAESHTKDREEHMKKRKEKSDFVPTSALRAEPSTSDEVANPEHAEDFTRLVNAAAKKQKPTD